MAKSLQAKDYKILSGGTENHLILIDLTNKNITGKEAEIVLEKAGITINKNMIPFDRHSPFITSGIRIGTPAITTRGLKEDDSIRIVEFIDASLQQKANDSELARIKLQIKNWISDFPLFS